MRLPANPVPMQHREAANVVGAFVIFAYVLLGSLGRDSIMAPDDGLPFLGTLARGVLMSSAGALAGALAYAILQGRRRLRLEPSGAVLSGVAGAIVFAAIAAIVSVLVGAAGYMLVLLSAAFCALAFEVSVVLLVLWVLALVAILVRGNFGRQDLG
jgi:hypothetical protein